MNKLLQLIISLRDEASAGIEKLNGSLGRMAEVAGGNLLAGAIEAAGQAVVGLGATTLSAASDFESATARFASVAGGSLAEAGFALSDVKDKALEMGAVTQFSAAEAQDAMINLAKGGVPVKDIMGQATQATLDLAAAGELQLATAADIVSKQLGVWGDTGVKAADVSNLLAQAANASTVDVDELALGLANVGGVAKVSGVSFQDLTQTMAMIAPGFSSAADAGTSLKTFFLALQPTTSAAKDAMSSLGLMTFDTDKALRTLGISGGRTAEESLAKVKFALQDMATAQSGAAVGTEKWNKKFAELYSQFEVSKFYDASGAFVGMDQAAQLLQGSMDGLSEAEQSAALKAIFGTDAFRAAALIAHNGSAGFQAMGQAMDAAGTAAEQAAVRNQTFKFAFDSLKGSLETIQIIIGSALLPVLTDLINNTLIPGANAVMEFSQAFLTAFSEASEFTSTFSEQVGAAIDTLMGVTDSIGPFQQLGIAISDVGRWVGDNLTPILATLATAITGFVVPAIYAWAMAQWTTAIPAAIATVTAMLPFIATVLAIAAVVGLLVAAWTNNWGGIQEKTAAVWAVLQPILAEIWDWLGVQLVAAGAALSAFWTGTLWPALQVVGAFITNTIVPVLAQLWSWLGVQLVAAGAALSAFWTGTLWPALQVVGAFITGTVIPAFAAIWNWLSTNIPAAIAAVVTAFTSVVTTVTTIVTAIQTGWNTVVTATTTTWNSIVTTVMGYVTSIQTSIQTGLDVVTTIVQAIWNTLVFVTSIAWAAVMTAIQPVLDWFSTTIGPVITAVSDSVSVGWTALSGTAATAWSAISSAVSTAWDAISGTVSTLAASVQGAVSTAWDAISSATSTAWDAVSTAVSTAIAAVESVVTSVITPLSGTVTSSWNEIQTSTDSIWSQVETIITGVTSAIQAVVQTATDIIQTAVTGAWSVIKAASENDFGSIPEIISGVWDDVKSTFNTGVEDVKKIFKGLASDAVSLGKDIVDGVIKGVSNAGSALTNKLRDLAKGALDAAKSILGIHSPSTVFADVIGEQIPAGIGAGVVKGMPAVNESLVKSVGALVDSVGKVVDSGMKSLRSVSAYEGPGGSGMSGFVAGIVAFATQLADAATLVGAAMMANAQKFAESAAKIFDMASKGVDVLTKIGNLGTVAPAAMQTFVTGMVQLITLLVAATATVDQTGFAAAQKFAEGGGKILGVIGTGVDALNKLATLSAAVPGSFLRFALYVRVLIGRMAELSAEISQDAMSAAIRFADGGGRVLAVLGAGVDALNKLAGMSDAVPGSFLRFALYVRVLIGRMAELAAEISQDAMSAAIKFAEGGGKVLGVLKTGVEALNALTNLAEAVPGSFATFALYVRVLIGRMAEMAAQVDQEALSAAVRFAEAAGKVIAIIKAGVDGLGALAKVTQVPAEAFQIFANGLDQIVTFVGYVAADFTAEGVSAAAAFAEGAGKILGIIKTGVDGLSALAGVESVPAAAFQTFANGIDAAITVIWNVSQDFTVAGMEAATAFAESAGKILGILKTGVDGLSALASMQDVPKSAFELFGVALAQIVSVLWSIAAQFTADGLAAAAAVAETGGKVVGILKNGVDGLNALDDLGPVSQAAISNFATAINQTMVLLGAAASQFSADAIAQAGRFAEAAGKAVGILKTGVEGLLMVDTFTGVSEAAIGRFADGVRLAVAAMARLAAEFGPEATAAANAFAKAAGESTDFLKKGVEGFIKLGELKDIPSAGLNLFAQGVVAVVQTIGRLSTILTVDALAQAVSVANGTDTVIETIKNALKAFVLLGQAASEIPNYVASFQQAVNTLSGNMQKLVVPPSQNIGMAMSLGIAAGITAGTPAIQNAIVAALQAALATARSALGIASPSKVFDELVGYQGGAGVAQGFERSIPMVTAAAGSMAAASIAPVAAATAGPVGPRGLVAGGGGGGGAQNLTIEKGAITIVQQPGESGDALAQRVMKLIEAKYRLRG